MEERNSASLVSRAGQRGIFRGSHPHPMAEKHLPQQMEGREARLGLGQFKAPQATPSGSLANLPKGLESGSDHLLYALGG